MAGNIYGYNPSIPAAVIFIVLFVLTTAHHCFQLHQFRSWYFIYFVIGGFFQIIGYICRAAGHNHEDSVPIYAMQTLFILLAPPFYAASIYMVLGRLVRHLNAERQSVVPVRWMTKIFVTGDVLSFVMQSAGGGIMSSGGSSSTTGSNVTIVGLVIQILFFGFFFITALIFHVRMRKTGQYHPISKADWKNKNWTTLLLALYVASVLILVRSVFRMIEFIDGYGGYLMTHEWFLYVFDALLMMVTMVVMGVYHPGYVLGSSKKANGMEGVRLNESI